MPRQTTRAKPASGGDLPRTGQDSWKILCHGFDAQQLSQPLFLKPWRGAERFALRRPAGHSSSTEPAASEPSVARGLLARGSLQRFTDKVHSP